MTRKEYSQEYQSLANARDMAVKAGDQKSAKRFRQLISKLYEDHGRLNKQEPTNEPDQAEVNRLDAERYRKLKILAEDPDGWDGFWWERGKFDAAVDALPERKGGE